MESVHFNPHEREARDLCDKCMNPNRTILIHTSVKLVTEDYINMLCELIILIHTSVKLVTAMGV